MPWRENTYRAPITRSVTRALHHFTGKGVEYRDWLAQQKTVPLLFSLERDWWTLLSGGIQSRLGKLDELKVAKQVSAEPSIRGTTLVDQLSLPPVKRWFRLKDLRLAHPLLLDQVPSQRQKFNERCRVLRKVRGRLAIGYTQLENLLPSSDPIVITKDPLGQAPYVAATGNGRLAALQAVLHPETQLELISFLE